MKIRRILFSSLLIIFFSGPAFAQSEVWTLSDCIHTALEHNLQVRQTVLTSEIKQVNKEQARASRFPTLDASVRQNFSWSDQQNAEGGYDFNDYNNTNLSLSSNLNLFNGFRTSSSIRQSQLEYNASTFDTEASRENISLQVLDYYLQVLYAEEQLQNSNNQLLSTQQQLALAGERMALRIISKADYLQVKAQEANEKLLVANAVKQLQLSRLNLMQIMEIPVNDSFAIEKPDFSQTGKQLNVSSADKIYATALEIKPQIKSAALQKQISAYDMEIAKAGYFPQLSLNAGLSSGYNSLAESLKFASQLDHNLTPTLGLTLSMPIFQQKQVRSQVSLAKINQTSAEINEQNIRNQLRKSVETAWANVLSAENEYDASNEQYTATAESFQVTTERFQQGVINSVDFLYEKTNLINAESKLLQARYNLIFNYKVLDFYQGKPLEL
ncbi:MAG: TolC family protein [Lentimicrobiaceae bacterium]|nr:TolC family protein [Lentimicrobiaceae bacterium]